MVLTEVQIPYRPYLSQQLTVAYDTYLAIQRSVDNQVKDSLGHNTPNWQLLNTCPACFYKLEDEPDLRFSFLCSFDGNNSLKRLADSARGNISRRDSRSIQSDRWVTTTEVNVFSDEVKSRVSTYLICKPYSDLSPANSQGI